MNNIIEILLKKLSYSLDGLIYFTKDSTFFLTTLTSIIFMIVSLIFIKRLEIKIIFVIFGLLIYCFEMINSIIENIVDRISLEKHELSKKIKDLSSCFQATYKIFVTICLLIIINYQENN